MKRRHFLKLLSGLIALPVVAKAKMIGEPSNTPERGPEFKGQISEVRFSDSYYDLSDAPFREELRQGIWRKDQSGKWNHELAYQDNGGWRAYFNGKEVPWADCVDDRGMVRFPDYYDNTRDVFECKHPTKGPTADFKIHSKRKVKA